MVLPQFTAVEHISEQLPLVPEVICDTPKICIFFIVPCLFDQCRSRRERQHDVAPALLNRAVQHLNLMRRRIRIVWIKVCIADIITLDIVNTPLRVQIHNGIIVFLSACHIFPHAVHVWIPTADGGRVCNLICRDICSQHRQMLVCCDSRNPAHNVNAKL